MSYMNFRQWICLSGHAATGAAITATGDKYFFSAPQPFDVKAIGFAVSTALQAADPATIAMEKRITVGSDTGRVTSGVPTMVVPGGTAAGKFVYYDELSYRVNPGEELVARLSDASAAGAGAYWMNVEWVPANPANYTNGIQSA